MAFAEAIPEDWAGHSNPSCFRFTLEPPKAVVASPRANTSARSSSSSLVPDVPAAGPQVRRAVLHTRVEMRGRKSDDPNCYQPRGLGWVLLDNGLPPFGAFRLMPRKELPFDLIEATAQTLKAHMTPDQNAHWRTYIEGLKTHPDAVCKTCIKYRRIQMLNRSSNRDGDDLRNSKVARRDAATSALDLHLRSSDAHKLRNVDALWPWFQSNNELGVFPHRAADVSEEKNAQELPGSVQAVSVVEQPIDVVVNTHPVEESEDQTVLEDTLWPGMWIGVPPADRFKRLVPLEVGMFVAIFTDKPDEWWMGRLIEVVTDAEKPLVIHWWGNVEECFTGKYKPWWLSNHKKKSKQKNSFGENPPHSSWKPNTTALDCTAVIWWGKKKPFYAPTNNRCHELYDGVKAGIQKRLTYTMKTRHESV